MAMASSASTASSTMRRSLSLTFRFPDVSQVTTSSLRSCFNVCSTSSPQASRSKPISALPPPANRTSRTAGAFLHLLLRVSASSRVRSGTRCQISRKPYHKPAGRMVLAASKKVQKYLCRIQSASEISSAESIGSASKTDRMAFSCSVRSPVTRDRMIPSLTRFPRPKGTVTRTPGSALSAIDGGMR